MKHLLLALLFLVSQNTLGSPGLGYTGRLVKSDGSPVTGTVDLSFELNYSGDTSTILCEETITGVSLQNGVYSVSLNFDSGAGACNLATVMQGIPGGQTLDIRVHDTTNSLTFNYQSIHSSPKAYISDFALDVLDGSITPDKISTTGASNGDVLTFSGGAWTFGAGGSGLSSLGGLTGSTQTFAIGTSGTAPAFSSAGSTHTFNIPMASSAGVTAGLISKTDYDNFISGAGTASVTLTAGTGMTGGGDLSADRTFNVDVGTTNGKIAQVGVGDKLDTSIIPNLEGLSNACGGGEKLISNGLGGFSCGSQTVTAGTGLTGGGALTSDITVAVDTGTTDGKIPVIGTGDKLPSSIVDDTTKLPLAGGTMTGNIDVNGNNVFSVSTLGLDGTTSGAISIAAPDTVTTYVLKLPANNGDPGQFLQTDGDGNTIWATVSAGGSGTVTSVSAGTGLTGGPITSTGSLGIANGGVGTTQLADDSVTAAKLADNAVSSTAISDGSITSAKIVDGTIANADIASGAAISYSKLSIADGDLTIAKTSGLSSALSAKLALAGGTMSGNIAMGSNKISGLPTPVANDEAATKAYVDAAAPDLADIKTKTSGTYNRDNHSLEALRERIDNLESSVSTIQTNVGNLDTDLAAVASGVTSLQGASGAFTWQVTTSDATLATGNAYAVSGSDILDFTLPASCTTGDSLQLTSGGDKGYRIFANTGQSILYNGAAGGIVITGFATVTITCVSDNTTWLIKNIEGGATVSKIDSGSSSALSITWFGISNGDLLNGQPKGLTGQIDSDQTSGACFLLDSDFYCIQDYSQANGNYQAYKVTNISNPQQVSIGSDHTCVLEASGGVKCFGRNNDGQLGNGTTDSSFSTTAVQVIGLTSGVSKIATVSNTTCADHNNEIKCWGSDNNGLLGNSGSDVDSSTPVTVQYMNNTGVNYLGYNGTGVEIDYLMALSNSFCALKLQRLYCWGSWGYGSTSSYDYPRLNITLSFDPELVLSSNTAEILFYNKETGYFNYVRRNDTTVSGGPLGVTGLDIISAAGDFLAIGGGSTSRASCFVLSDNTMRCLGVDVYGQQLNGASDSDVSSLTQRATSVSKVISNGGNATSSFCMIKLSTDLFCWGYNSNYQTGGGTESYYYSEQWVATDVLDARTFSTYGIAQTSQGTLAWGNHGGSYALPIGYLEPSEGTSRAVNAKISSSTLATGAVESWGIKTIAEGSSPCVGLNNKVLCHGSSSVLPLGESYYYPWLRELSLEP